MHKMTFAIDMGRKVLRLHFLICLNMKIFVCNICQFHNIEVSVPDLIVTYISFAA